ncbi:signal peptidase I [Candidatus Enterococcus mansonii]|uniref:Signal peptidase I n=1 Tax=Candidatus Enterococcus mansonii TaxID=1834181 RepID=A0A242CFS0_9ENTE|nr:signal peptidase I [Enterococcus sp. 4G2_DIV0659]OTO08770.1 signal peptidase I [Enterococcus sp. 4G2_DIV0659]
MKTTVKKQKRKVTSSVRIVDSSKNKKRKKKDKGIRRQASVVKRKKKLIHLKKKSKRSVKKRKRKLWKKSIRRIVSELISSIALAALFIWVISLFTFTFTRIDGYGMMPTLTKNDTVFVNRLGEKKRFKLVYIKLPNNQGTSVRRIIGLPGEEIKYSKDKLYVDHVSKEEKFILDEIQQADANSTFYTEDFTINQKFKTNTIPKGKFLVLGDNRPYSTDSRYFGLIDEKSIIGVVEMRVLPIHKMVRY